MLPLKFKKKNIILTIIIVLSIFNVQNINAAVNDFNKCVEENLYTQKKSISKIESLYCNNKNISNLPSLKKYTSLKRLELNNNKLKNINIDITTLRELYLNNNEINIISTSILKNQNLIILSLSGNMIYSLPTDINNLNNLKELYLASTHLISIPNLNKLMKLQVLDLKNNQLMQLPSLNNIPLIDLSIKNNYLKINTIKTKSKVFKIGKQKKLMLKNNEVKLNVKNKLFTLQEQLQRGIVSTEGIPLYGVKYYKLINGITNDGKAINPEDYIDIENNKIRKAGSFNADVLIVTPNNNKVKTNLKIKYENDVETTDDEIIIVENKDNNSKTSNITINSEKEKSDNKNEKDKNALAKELDEYTNMEFSEKEAFKFFQFSNIFILRSLLALIILIPLIILIVILYKSRKAIDDVEEIL